MCILYVIYDAPSLLQIALTIIDKLSGSIHTNNSIIK